MNYVDVQRSVTKAFINFSPVIVQLIPRSKVSDGQGGFKKVVQTARQPQTFALIEPGDSGFSQPVVPEAGEQYTVQYMLLGMHDAVMAKDDVFSHGGKEFKLLEVMPDNGYEKRAVVIRHGW